MNTHPLTRLLRQVVPRRQCCSAGTAGQSLHSLTGSHSRGGPLWHRHAVQPATHTQSMQFTYNPYITYTQPILNRTLLLYFTMQSYCITDTLRMRDPDVSGTDFTSAASLELPRHRPNTACMQHRHTSCTLNGEFAVLATAL